jgi:hypothetical protein
MAQQTFETHAHRPVATGVGYLCVLVALAGFALRWNGIGGRTSFAIGLLGVIGAELALLFISRSYITALQDRIIKLEMRLRCAALLTPDQLGHMLRLGNKHVVALRFASDAELPALLDRAVRERLSPADIKRAVTSWTPDFDRT